MVSQEVLQVKAIWDKEALVWVAESDDVPGLITEAESLEELVQKLKIMISELLEANGNISKFNQKEIPFHLLSERTEFTKCKF